jgi:hypothetical protein
MDEVFGVAISEGAIANIMARAEAPMIVDFMRRKPSCSKKLGRSPKTHSGVQTQFAKLAKNEPSIDLELRAFLGRAYNLKAIADYETGPGSNVTHAQATEAIATAHRLLATIVGLIDGAG